jgi:hypothetical protein
LASVLFPGEEWVAHGENIFVAKSRLNGSHKEQAKLYREISDARILTSRGSVAYFLPEYEKDGGEVNEIHILRADTVIDGAVRPYQATGQRSVSLSGGAINRPFPAKKIWHNGGTFGISAAFYPLYH